MAEGGTSFWKVFLGVLAALAVGGSCLVGGCILLLGYGVTKTAQKMDEQKKTREDYVHQLAVKIDKITGDQYVHVLGSVKNEGDRVVTYWKLTISFQDETGAQIDTTYTNSIERLVPGGIKAFDAMHRTPPGLKTATAEIEEVRLE